MNWPGAIEHNRVALLRIVAMLFDFLGLEEGGVVATLPRHLRNTVLRILRPAESAVRRLIVIVARELPAEFGPRRPCDGKKPRRKEGYAWIVYPPGYRPEGEKRVEADKTLSLPLLDPRKRFDFGPRRRYSKSFPRITCIGLSEPTPIPDGWFPSPDDPVDAKRLALRLTALKRALDDLPGQAKRLARWKARRALRSSSSSGLTRGSPYSSPMRPGWPPGYRKRPFHEVDDVLRECHSLAVHAQSPDTS